MTLICFLRPLELWDPGKSTSAPQRDSSSSDYNNIPAESLEKVVMVERGDKNDFVAEGDWGTMVEMWARDRQNGPCQVRGTESSEESRLKQKQLLLTCVSLLLLVQVG